MFDQEHYKNEQADRSERRAQRNATHEVISARDFLKSVLGHEFPGRLDETLDVGADALHPLTLIMNTKTHRDALRRLRILSPRFRRHEYSSMALFMYSRTSSKTRRLNAAWKEILPRLKREGHRFSRQHDRPMPQKRLADPSGDGVLAVLNIDGKKSIVFF